MARPTRADVVARRAKNASAVRAASDAVGLVVDAVVCRLQPYQVPPNSLELVASAELVGASDVWPSRAVLRAARDLVIEVDPLADRALSPSPAELEAGPVAEPDELSEEIGRWNTWLMSSGRGVGKTFSGAANSVLMAMWGLVEATDQALKVVELHPEREFKMPEEVTVFAAGPTWGHVVQTMLFESDSSVVSMLPDWAFDAKRSPRSISAGFPKVVLDMGVDCRVQVMGLSAKDPDRWRGKEGFHGWWDEPAACVYASECYRQWLQLLRRSNDPKLLMTCTPNFAHPSQELIWLLCAASEGDQDAIRELRMSMGGILGGGVVVRRQVPSWANAGMPESWRDEQRQLAATGTPWARQEVLGELAEPTSGVLIARGDQVFCPPPLREQLSRVVVGVDPAVGDGSRDEWGVVVVGELKVPVPVTLVGGVEKLAWFVVLADDSVGAHPEAAIEQVAKTAHAWDADMVMVERNQGGLALAALVQNGLAAIDWDMTRFDTCWASDPKGARAQNWAGRMRMGLLAFSESLNGGLLSSQCAMWDPDRDQRNSPDRVDAVGIGAGWLGLNAPDEAKRPSRPARGYRKRFLGDRRGVVSHRPGGVPR